MWISQTSPEQSKQKPDPNNDSTSLERFYEPRGKNQKRQIIYYDVANQTPSDDTHFYASIPLQYYLRYLYESDT